MYVNSDSIFKLVNDTFIRFNINHFRVVVELNLDGCYSIYIIGSELVTTETRKLSIVEHINVLLSTNSNMPSELPYKKTQKHISLRFYDTFINIELIFANFKP